MKKDFIYFSVKHPVSTIMAILAILMLGLICIFSIKIDYLPFITEKNILVTTTYEGVSAKELEKLVTIPIEDSFASLKGIKNIRSVTRDGISLLDIELQWGYDIDLAITEAREIIDMCYQTLPSGSTKPVAKIYTPSNKNSITIAVSSFDNDLSYARYIIDNEIKQRIQRINGVSSVEITGGDKQQIQVLVDKTLIDSRQLTLSSIAQCLATANFEYPAGTIREGNKDIMLKTSGLYKDLSEILSTPVSYNNGGVLYLSDIAEVKKTNRDREAFFMYNGKDSIEIAVKKKNSQSPLKLSQDVKQEVKTLNELYGSYFKFEIVQDNSTQIKDSMIQLLLSALCGFFITFIILCLFFKKFKTSLLVASIIPLSILFSCAILFLFGKTINILSLSGIAIGIGMVIDASTIVIESIQNRLSDPDTFIDEKIICACQEVSLSTVGSTLTTIVVFIPFFFERGLFGELFSDLAIAVIASISFSCLLGLTYIPAVTYLIERNSKNHVDSSLQIYSLEQKYKRHLEKCFYNKITIPAIFLLCIIFSIIPVKLLKKEFLPETFSEELNVELFFPSGTTVESLYDTSNYLSSVISGLSPVKKILLTGGIDPDNKNILIDPSKQTERIYLTIFSKNNKFVKKELETLFKNTKIQFNFLEDTSLLSSLLSAKSNSYILSDSSEELVSQKANSLLKDKNKIIPNSFSTEYVFTPDRLVCSRFNITAIYTAQLAHDTLEGVGSSYYYEKGIRIPIIVKYPDQKEFNIESVENTNILLQNSFLPLRVLGSFHEETNENIHFRYNRKNSKILSEVPDTNEKINLLDEQKVQLKELFGNTAIILIIILFLLYCIMGAQFESFLIPALILVSIPPAFSGAFISLLFTGKTININSVIALVVLFGTSVNNAIILYEKINTLTLFSIEEVIKASAQKLRPILITTITTICGLIPFAIDPLNKNAQSSMAIAIIGGLIVSTIFVLLIVPPILYLCMRKNKNE